MKNNNKTDLGFMQRMIADEEMGDVIFRKQASNKHYIIRFKRGTILVTFPIYGTYQKAFDFFCEHREKLLVKYRAWKTKEVPAIDENEMRKEAKVYLKNRLMQLASDHGFHYETLKISKSRNRWGSCSSKGSINLSLYLLLLPEHLIDYVILHELCHTVHLNHSSVFWNLLDQHTDGKMKLLRKELKNYQFS